MTIRDDTMNLNYFFNVRSLIIFFLILNFSFGSSYAAKPIICNHEYALCTSARCVPDPRHPSYAICHCVVKKGASAGYKTCAERAPTQDQYKTTQIISTFSFAQFAVKKFMSCQAGAPWTNCLDAPCTVDPKDHNRAICSCKIDNTQSFVTLGGECNTTTCTTGFWSGATEAASITLRDALSETIKKLSQQSSCSSMSSKK